MKGSCDWKWYLIDVENEGEEDNVRMILNVDMLASHGALQMIERSYYVGRKIVACRIMEMMLQFE